MSNKDSARYATKQEEFLEQLKDPNLYNIRRGVNEFMDQFNHIIHSADVNEIDNGSDNFREWQVSMYAYTHGQVLSLSSMMIEYIKEYAPNATVIKQKFDPETKYCGLYIQSYYVVFK